jgi:hypothetical protein
MKYVHHWFIQRRHLPVHVGLIYSFAFARLHNVVIVPIWSDVPSQEHIKIFGIQVNKKKNQWDDDKEKTKPRVAIAVCTFIWIGLSSDSICH